MKHNQQIAYYCFNKLCNTSLFYNDAIHLNLPFSFATITTDQFCRECGRKLVSLHDIEIKQALLATPVIGADEYLPSFPHL